MIASKKNITISLLFWFVLFDQPLYIKSEQQTRSTL